jgi:predicted  nucleic acid-binding Zn-ribbon protein
LKICTTCGSSFSEDEMVCPNDGTTLFASAVDEEDAADSGSGQAMAAAQVMATRPATVAPPADDDRVSSDSDGEPTDDEPASLHEEDPETLEVAAARPADSVLDLIMGSMEGADLDADADVPVNLSNDEAREAVVVTIPTARAAAPNRSAGSKVAFVVAAVIVAAILAGLGFFVVWPMFQQ